MLYKYSDVLGSETIITTFFTKERFSVFMAQSKARRSFSTLYYA